MRLVKNEWMKLWSQKNTWAMLMISITLLVLITGLNKYFDPKGSTAEQRAASNEENIAQYEASLATEGITEEEKVYYEEEILLAEYRIEHDMKASQAMYFNDHMSFSSTISLLLIGIFTVVIAASIVSNEFGTGTIKMLLTRPVARWKILLSKLMTSILFGVFLLVVTAAFSALLGVMLFGTEASTSLVVLDGQVVEQAIENSYVETTLYALASTIVTILFAFMMGTLFGSSTLAVSLALFILLAGSTATLFIAQYDFAKYIWFANDFTQFAPGSSPILPDVTLSFAIVVNIAYAIIFLAVSFIYFMKRDVTA